MAGAGGYVGGRLVGHLGRAGVEVVPLVRTPRPWLPASQRSLDLRRPSADLDGLLRDVDAVVHLAGPSEVHAAADPERVLADTVAISSVLGRASATAGVARFVYLSTVHVYGARVTPGAVIREDLRCEPHHPYAIARLASEHVLAGAGLPLTVLRMTNAVGAPADPAVDRWTLLVNDLCRQAALGRRIELLTDGTQWRDFVSLADALSIVTRLSTGSLVPGTWNLCSGGATTVRDVAGLVQDAFEERTGDRPPLVAPDASAPPTAPPVIDAGGLSAHGLECSTPLRTAVDEVAEFCLRHRGALVGDPAAV